MLLNRKVLADIAITEPLSFRAVIEVLKDASGGYDPKALRPKVVEEVELKSEMNA
jgi:ribosomal protein L20